MTRVARLLALTAALAAAACAKDGAATSADSAAVAAAPAPGAIAGANVVTITALDFKFTGPTEIPAGLTTLRLVNQGPEIHHAQIFKLEEGKTGADWVAAFRTGGPPAWSRPVGGPNAPLPGKESNATSTLEPGTYALVCFVDTPDKTPHFFKGMVHDFKVVASAQPAAAEPTANATISLNDFSFQAPDSLAAGTHLFRVENAGAQPHEVELFKLQPGKTMRDLQAWSHSLAGPPPATPIGGIVALAPGTHAFFSAELDAGEYALWCFFPDPKSKKPHFDLGMMRLLKIS